MLFKYGLILCTSFTCLPSAQAEQIKIYAAASLNNALTDIANFYESQHPNIDVVPVFGASSTLAKQIEAGAKSDLFFSADTDWMKYLMQKQRVQIAPIKSILFNQLVLIGTKNVYMPFKPEANFAFSKAFKGRLCSAEMESVPAGKYAKQALLKLNWLDDLKGRIVGTQDVRATLALVERGECTVGIVYKTDAMISHRVKILGKFPNNFHDPIIYTLALTLQGEKSKAALQFEKFIRTHPYARSIFLKYGFGVTK